MLDTPFPSPIYAGRPDPANAQTLLDGLTLAAQGCLDGRFSALVTAPVAKGVIADAGIPFTGHTEFLARITNAGPPVMMLVAGDLRVALASTHLPLKAVPSYITIERLRHVIETIDSEDFAGSTSAASVRPVVCPTSTATGKTNSMGTGNFCATSES